MQRSSQRRDAYPRAARAVLIHKLIPFGDPHPVGSTRQVKIGQESKMQTGLVLKRIIQQPIGHDDVIVVPHERIIDYLLVNRGRDLNGCGRIRHRRGSVGRQSSTRRAAIARDTSSRRLGDRDDGSTRRAELRAADELEPEVDPDEVDDALEDSADELEPELEPDDDEADDSATETSAATAAEHPQGPARFLHRRAVRAAINHPGGAT